MAKVEKQVTFRDRVVKFVKSPYMLVVPAFLFYAIFWAFPVVSAVKEVFTSIDGGFTFDNIIIMFNKPKFGDAVINTLVFAVVSIFIQFILALALALLINRNFKGSSFFLFIMMIPMAIPISAVGIIWNTGLNELGWINSVLNNLGIENLMQWMGFLGDGEHIVWKNVSGLQAVGFLIIVDTWTVLPSVMIIILAGLQNLNKEYSEASLVFGATRMQSVKDIVIPIIKPTIITSLLLRIISGVQVWLISVMIFGLDNLPFLVERIVYYNTTQFGAEAEKMAVTYSLLVVLIVMTIAIIFLRFNRDAERRNA